MTRLPLILVTCAALLVTAAPATAASSSKPQRTASKPQRTVAMDLVVKRFVVKRGRVFADATATSRVRTRNGKLRSSRQQVLLRTAASSKNCRILTLRLEDLQLKLLGLNLNTSAINLRITGDDKQALGRLFCSLAKGVRLSKATRSLNRRLSSKPMRVLGVRSTLPSDRRYAQQQTQKAAPQCNVLRLVLGPLDLDLLGLVVELYGGDRSKPVVVEVTATPGGGVLGDLFCQLANTGVTLKPAS